MHIILILFPPQSSNGHLRQPLNGNRQICPSGKYIKASLPSATSMLSKLLKTSYLSKIIQIFSQKNLPPELINL